ncbi:DUF6311 domain-containing protein [Flavobacterium sp. SUN052]|uniref:DUF6311 domain-containing protein n=1 Tax=Flavobacterium sp. SUN052 TaxID=3002441 RepID=UPI00237D38B5|nr:DUF6311 domain-containing protein [Flavobacterium sp. SUN052]MEC4003521.1 DUF6311 domain-containing protein [Flavobacterium sp. SUN052]
MYKTLKNKTYLFSAIIVLIGFQLVYGLEIIFPSNINWIMSAYHDWGQHYLGWAYFRSEPWHFPLGHIENYNYPAGTNVGYTDSIPLLAIFFKTFSFLLPETFQYLGIWLLVCHLLTGFYTVKILELFKAKPFYIYLAVILIVFNPILVYRGMHPALCAHWLLLASIYFYLINPNSKNVDAINKKQIIITILSALINPYLLLMIIGFNIILPFKHFYYSKLISLKKMALYIISPILVVLFFWIIIGLLAFDNSVKMNVENSYGLYSFNLNSFWNPCGFSPIIPQLNSATPQQYEGYGYLGLGIIILLITTILFAIVPIIKNKQYKNKGLIPFFILVFLSIVFAVTNKVTFYENTLFTIPLPEIALKFGGIFRASGRFIWLMYYSLFLISILLLVKNKLSDKIKIPFLILITFIQLYDTKPMLASKNLSYGDYKNEKISEKEWVNITSNFKRIITVKPFDNNLLYTSSYQDLCIMALKNKLPITCGYVARETQEINNNFKDSLLININEAEINRNDLFLTTANDIPNFYNLINKNKVNIRYLDGFYYLYSKENKINLNINKTNLENRKIDSIIKSVRKANEVFVIDTPVFEKNKIQFNFEKNIYRNDIIQLNGWAIKNDSYENKNDSIYILLTNENKTFLYKTNPTKRPDVTAAKNKGNLNNAGFSISIYTDKLNQEKYSLAIAIKDKNNKWTYQLVDQSPKFDLKKKAPPLLLDIIPKSTGNIIGNVEKAELQAGNIYIEGWAAINKQDATSSQIKVTLNNGKIIYEIETDKTLREDVTSSIKDNFNYNDSGFSVRLKQNQIKAGQYKVGILITDKNSKKAVLFSDKTLIIK